jgi:glyoxylase-like metal-dependent hydrolase (beta-lactamase superfamily II)/predicted esterase
VSGQEARAEIAGATARGALFSETGMALQYRLFAPEVTPGETYPLILFLHGLSGRGQDNESQLAQEGGVFPFAMPDLQAKHPCFVAIPQCPEGRMWTDAGMPELVKALIEQLLKTQTINPMRVYITGLSMGGFGVWHMIATYPELFAAAMPVCGGAAIYEMDQIGQLPVWAFHATDDDVVPVSGEMSGAHGSRLAVTAARLAGSMNIRYTEYPAGMVREKWGDAHASWAEAYRDQAAIDWLFAQDRRDKYEYALIAPGVWEIADCYGDSFYVVEGPARALVIDTGMARGNIRALVETLTSRPYDLALTHGHGDHSYHASQFDRIYLSLHDKEMLYGARFAGQIAPDADALVDIQDGDAIDLGDGHLIEVIALPGHTPGSLLFVDARRKCVFTGDAVGSGAGVWMQVPGASNLSEYANNIAAAKEKLLSMGVEPAGWAFLGGHASQRYTQGYNPVSYELMDDLIALCAKLISGEIIGTEETGQVRFGQVLHARHARAEMLYKQGQLR